MKRRTNFINLLLLLSILYLSFDNVINLMTDPYFKAFFKDIFPDKTIKDLVYDGISDFISICIIIYSFYFFIYNNTLLSKKKSATKKIMIIVVVLALDILITFILESTLTKTVFSFKDINFLSFAFTIFFLGGIGMGVRGLVESFEQRDKKKELLNKNLQSELKFLRSRINPHFIFNALNNIDSILRNDPVLASDLIIKLSQQMRYMLYESNAEFIDLNSELQFINDYITFQKIKLKNKDAVHFTVEGDFDSGKIPPMLFIPYIENAFKHCSELKQNGAIQIRLQKSENMLWFKSENIFNPTKKEITMDKNDSMGMDLTEKRLNMILPDKHELIIVKFENIFKVNLKVQLDEI